MPNSSAQELNDNFEFKFKTCAAYTNTNKKFTMNYESKLLISKLFKIFTTKY